MQRIPNQRYAEVIGRAYQNLPEGLRHRLGHVQFLCGVSPIFAGLHLYDDIKDNHERSYRNVAHCVYSYHQSFTADRRVVTIVLPRLVTPRTVVHELGHALHEIVGFKYQAEPVSDYARTNHFEAFAESFTTWRYFNHGSEDAFQADARTKTLFESLRSR